MLYHPFIDRHSSWGECSSGNIFAEEVIGEKGVRITPDIMASGGGGIGTLLLLNLFRDQMQKNNENGGNGNGNAPAVVTTNGSGKK